MINTLHLGLSYNCNMKCKHCFVNKDSDNLNINKLKKTIDDLEKKGLFFVIYTFGEPFLSKDFWEISKYVSSKGMIQTVMTNGSLVTSNIIKKLKDNKINNVYVSMDSIDEEKHDFNRNYQGAYHKAINAIKLLIDNKFNVGIAVTINNKNVLEMDEFANLGKRMGVKSISFLRQRNNSQLSKLNHIKTYNNFYKMYLCGEKNINILFHDPTLLELTKELYNQRCIDINTFEKYYDMNSCHYSDTLSIEPNGNVKFCNLINNKIGNINNSDINEILENGCEKNECFICCSKFSK